MSIVGLNVMEIAEKIIDGYRLSRKDDLSILITAPLEDLEKAAGKIQEKYRQNTVELCTIINGKSGRCPENCKYCAQSAHHKTACDVYDFLPKDQIVAEAQANEAAGVNRCAIVTAGRSLTGADFEKALECYKEMRATTKLGLCASMGLITPEQFQRLKAVGVTRYHNNIETSRRNFPNICTTHTFDQKIATIKAAQAAGLTVCSGGILGMGETFEDRIDMALELSELGIKSIPINFLIPIPGTPLENQEQISSDDAMRSIAIFRFINPEANVRLAAGRKVLPGFGSLAFKSGASATITGDMLTTSGTTIKGDLEILAQNGQINKK
ncbi:MAG: biotin synthase BioB [Phascolarctobacterium sp.]|nr:biotin synthase BioB [Phascolarctobacterium sp.]